MFAAPPVAGARRIVVVGHSLGGHFALLAAAAGTIRADALVTVATGTSSSAARSTRRSRLTRAAQVRLVVAVAGAFGYWPGDRLGFGGRQPRDMMRDWGYEARSGRNRLAGDPTDYEAALRDIDVPTLLIAVAGDPLVPAAAVDHLAGRLPDHVSRSTMDGGGDHFRWARVNPGVLVDAVENWPGLPGA